MKTVRRSDGSRLRDGEEGHISFADVTAIGIQLRGVRGVIIEGARRDLDELSEHP